MVIIGRRNPLTVLRSAPPGFYLDAGVWGEVLLPGALIPSGADVGDVLDVFLYRDSEDRLVATSEIPYVQVGEFACLEAVGFTPGVGVFLDWGLAKDILVPMRELRTPRVQAGDWLVVHVFLDERSNRIIASERTNRHLRTDRPDYAEDQPVNLLISSETPLGYKAIVDNAYEGLLYHSDLAGPLEQGKRMDGYVRTVREDSKIDLSLDLTGQQRFGNHAETVLSALEASGGQMPFHDKSSPEEIRAAFGMSKKAFKQVIGVLFKERKIVITAHGIEIARAEK